MSVFLGIDAYSCLEVSFFFFGVFSPRSGERSTNEEYLKVPDLAFPVHVVLISTCIYIVVISQFSAQMCLSSLY